MFRGIKHFQEGIDADVGVFEAEFNDVLNLFRDDAGHSIMNISINERTTDNLLQTAWIQNTEPTTNSCSIDAMPEMKKVSKTMQEMALRVRGKVMKM
jgi:hypothetical protein